MNSLQKHLPSDYSHDSRYFEPFLGAGSLFFRLRPTKSTLSDNNKDLIECYQSVQARPDLVVKYLQEHLAKNCEKYYCQVREKYNTSRPSFAKAALFIYLNKTCFNGIWRVNRNGKFNVPYGHRNPKPILLKQEILAASEALSGSSIFCSDYNHVVGNAKKGDLVYFDPPYPPLNGTSYFTHYTKEGFDERHHAALASAVSVLDKKGAYFMVSNADLPHIRGLYEGFSIHELEVMRWIRSDGKRYCVRELIITNYDVETV